MLHNNRHYSFTFTPAGFAFLALYECRRPSLGSSSSVLSVDFARHGKPSDLFHGFDFRRCQYLLAFVEQIFPSTLYVPAFCKAMVVKTS